MPRTSPRVEVNPEVMKWAIAYSRREPYLRAKYPKLAEWEAGTVRPTWKQLQGFAKDARVAFGYLFGNIVPSIKIDIPDLRTIADQGLSEPSPDMVSTVFACQRRQDWILDFADSMGLAELPFVGSFSVTDSPSSAATEMRCVLDFGSEKRYSITRRDYRKALVESMEAAGVFVMVNGVVGNDTSRALDVSEFRGFALSDPIAPVVFVNANDSLGAQLFTLAHEFAHILLGESGVSAPDSALAPRHGSENWCNAVAAEFLVPITELYGLLGDRAAEASIDRLGRHFKVSDLVVLRRLRESKTISSQTFRREYEHAVARARQTRARPTGGGNFYANLVLRVSRRFAESIYWNTLAGTSLYAHAFRLLGISQAETMHKLGEHMGLKR